MDVKYMAHTINSMASELAEAGWDVNTYTLETNGEMHVRTTAQKGGVEVESVYKYPKENAHGTA